MPENVIEIFLKLRDQLTAGMEKARVSLQKTQTETKKFSQDMRTLSRDLSQASASFAFMGASITGPMLLAFRNASKYSADVQDSITKLNNAFGQIQLTIANNLVPIINKFTDFLGQVYNAFNKLTPETQKFIIQGLFISGIVLIASSLFLKLASIFVRLTGLISKASMAIIAFIIGITPLQAIILLIVGALVALIFFFDKLEFIARSVFNTLNLGWRLIYSAIKLVESSLWRVAQATTFLLLPVSNAFKKLADNAEAESKKAAQGIGDIFDTGKSPLADNIAKFNATIKEIWETLTNPPEATINFDAQMEALVQSQRMALEQLKTQWRAWQDEKTAVAMAAMQTETERLNFYLETQKAAHQSFWVVIGKMKDTFSGGISKMFVDMIKGVTTAKEAIKELGFQMLQILIDFMVQKVINLALSKAAMAIETAMSTAMASVLALAWAPVAALVSLATFGANAAPAAAGIASITAMTEAIATSAMAGGAVTLGEGGIVTRPTMALIGERGPEAVIPLTDNRNLGIGSVYIEHAYFQSDQDIEDIFLTLSRMLQNKRRAKI